MSITTDILMDHSHSAVAVNQPTDVLEEQEQTFTTSASQTTSILHNSIFEDHAVMEADAGIRDEISYDNADNPVNGLNFDFDANTTQQFPFNFTEFLSDFGVL
jgi:hypothetical protein